jgi:hypothetical protein
MSPIYEVFPPELVCGCSPALMYLTCPAMHTTKLPFGRPSTSCLLLRSYSEAGIPGVTSPGLTARARATLLSADKEEEERKKKWRRGRVTLTEVGVGFRGGLAKHGWLGWKMMRVDLCLRGLSSIRAA